MSIKVRNPNLGATQAGTYPTPPAPTPLEKSVACTGNWAEVFGQPAAEEPGTPHNVHEAKVADRPARLSCGVMNDSPTHDAAVGGNERIGPVPEREGGKDPAVSGLTAPGFGKLPGVD